MWVHVASPNGLSVSAAKPRTAARPAKLDSDKFGDEATRPNRWLDCIMNSIKSPPPPPPHPIPIDAPMLPAAF